VYEDTPPNGMAKVVFEYGLDNLAGSPAWPT
jgi:hypothetical protein